MTTTRQRYPLLPAMAALAWPLIAASAPPLHPEPHAKPEASLQAGWTFEAPALVIEAEAGEGGWERMESSGTPAIRATKDASMRYHVRFDEPGIYYMHLRCHHAAGMPGPDGKPLPGHSTNDVRVTVGGAPLFGTDKQTRPVGMRCHSRTLQWWSLPKGPGGHTPEGIKDHPVHLLIPTAGVYAVELGYRSPGMVIDQVAFTRDPEPPARP